MSTVFGPDRLRESADAINNQVERQVRRALDFQVNKLRNLGAIPDSVHTEGVMRRDYGFSGEVFARLANRNFLRTNDFGLPKDTLDNLAVLPNDLQFYVKLTLHFDTYGQVLGLTTTFDVYETKIRPDGDVSAAGKNVHVSDYKGSGREWEFPNQPKTVLPDFDQYGYPIDFSRYAGREVGRAQVQQTVRTYRDMWGYSFSTPSQEIYDAKQNFPVN